MYTCSYVAHNDFGLTRPLSDVVFICTSSSGLPSATLECVSLDCGHIWRAAQDMRNSLPSLLLPVSNLFLAYSRYTVAFLKAQVALEFLCYLACLQRSCRCVFGE